MSLFLICCHVNKYEPYHTRANEAFPSIIQGGKKVHITQLERLLEIESSEQEKMANFELHAIFPFVSAGYFPSDACSICLCTTHLHTTDSEVCVL